VKLKHILHTRCTSRYGVYCLLVSKNVWHIRKYSDYRFVSHLLCGGNMELIYYTCLLLYMIISIMAMSKCVCTDWKIVDLHLFSNLHRGCMIMII